ncbi:hypothetical protein AX14_010565 [Amanita brunnescens Koide BX004]|nr:hypothetical protein AX14_010565 [Amanita brunnescens Koide BX004]
MPSAEAKLTKKQKKAIAFRSRAKKTHATASEPQTETLPSPALEGEGQTDDKRLALEVGFMEEESPSDVGSDVKGKGRVDRKVELTKAQKRKRETSDDDGQGIKEQKKMKKEESALQGRKGRFILFVGNLKYSTTIEGIREHFSSCDPPPDVRLLTPKVSVGKQTTRSKGCAFLEFTNQKGLQQALKLHQSMLDGRMINVELTAGGGGKGEARMVKLQERNKHLYSQRKKKAGEGESQTASLDQPQRYSATSGVGQVPKQKRTWSVGDSIESKKPKRRRPTKNLGTGVNAIPVG